MWTMSWIRRGAVRTSLAFLVACGSACSTGTGPKAGTIEVDVLTTGANLDPDGYTLSVNGVDQQVAVDDTLALADRAPGSYRLELKDVAANCSVAGDNPLDLTLAGNDRARADFVVSCDAMLVDQIVFTSDRDGDFELYAMNPDGSDVRRLTRSPGWDGQADLSWNRTRIAFESERAGSYDIYTMKVDGSDLRQLTSGGAYSPAWSPDGTAIAFMALSSSNNEDIFVMNADGTGVTQLTTDPSIDTDPAWSPDGSQIVFMTQRNGDYGDLYTMRPDGSGLKQLTSPPTHEDNPVFSPDGTRIAFVGSAGGFGAQLFIMNADGTDQLRLTQGGPVNLPTWSPDGARIAFSAYTEGAGNYDVYVINADGTGLVNLTNNPATDIYPAWSRR